MSCDVSHADPLGSLSLPCNGRIFTIIWGGRVVHAPMPREVDALKDVGGSSRSSLSYSPENYLLWMKWLVEAGISLQRGSVN